MQLQSLRMIMHRFNNATLLIFLEGNQGYICRIVHWNYIDSPRKQQISVLKQVNYPFQIHSTCPNPSIDHYSCAFIKSYSMSSFPEFKMDFSSGNIIQTNQNAPSDCGGCPVPRSRGSRAPTPCNAGPPKDCKPCKVDCYSVVKQLGSLQDSLSQLCSEEKELKDINEKLQCDNKVMHEAIEQMKCEITKLRKENEQFKRQNDTLKACLSNTHQCISQVMGCQGGSCNQ